MLHYPPLPVVDKYWKVYRGITVTLPSSLTYTHEALRLNILDLLISGDYKYHRKDEACRVGEWHSLITRANNWVHM